MGHVYQKVRVLADKTTTLQMLVDTGATYSLMPSRIARELGIRPLRRRVTITLADGSRRRFKIGTAVVQIDGREAPASFLLSDFGEPILGVDVLEGLGFKVDPKKGRLIPSRPYAVRLGGYR